VINIRKSGRVSYLHLLLQKGKWGKLESNLLDSIPFVPFSENLSLAKNAKSFQIALQIYQKLSPTVYLLCDTEVLLLGRYKSSWYNLDWFAFKSFEMTLQLLVWCKSLTTGLMHLMNNLTR
jgi:hypothetical protein